MSAYTPTSQLVCNCCVHAQGHCSDAFTLSPDALHLPDTDCDYHGMSIRDCAQASMEVCSAPQMFAVQLVGLATYASLAQSLMGRGGRSGVHLDHVTALVHELSEVADRGSTALHTCPCLGEGTPALLPPADCLSHLHCHFSVGAKPCLFGFKV